ncbi:MAG: diphosphomevalonate decarboxylase [Thermoplasmata archaeon]|nr:diphosphomevalonate decarboxylase [Thermoplasmata archaeon]
MGEREPARRASYEASPNIALVKYWGVRDTALGLPYNSSFSVTLDRLKTRTTVTFEPDRTEDELLLNGEVGAPAATAAVGRFLDRVRAMASLPWRATVRSTNNFQTASGLASSASGFAALAGAAAAASGLDLPPSEISRLARFGSGSACRSTYGGFVRWHAGSLPDGSDCRAEPVLPAEHWPELVDLVALVANAPTKGVRSALAMQTTVETSPQYTRRLEEVPARLEAIEAAIRRRSAEELFPLVIEECDSFRNVCESTEPSLDYLTATSRRILGAVRELNRTSGRPMAGYTHDAGAHVHVFTLEEDLPKLRASLRKVEGISRFLALKPGPGGRLVSGPPTGQRLVARRRGTARALPRRARAARAGPGK